MDVKLLLAVVVVVGMAVASAFERRANKARARDGKPASSAVLIVVKVPESVSPTDRIAKCDEPLAAALTRESLGKVIGGTTDLTVEVIDFASGLPFLKRELLRLGVPGETTLQFAHFGVQVAE